ncbi:MAG: HAMP domain-containing protein [Methylobacteriaceae bacterium]|nr:HAMP domain-containing protein [Methylobacteriaceae bacterium]
MNASSFLSPVLGARLGPKLLAGLAAVLALASLAGLLVFIPLYHRELAGERQAVSSRLGAFLQIALENAMLKRDIEGLRQIVERLGEVEGVRSIAILSPDLETRFSSRPGEVGRRHETLEALCPACGLDGRRGGLGSAFAPADRGDVLRAVAAVANREACAGCHGPARAQPVNGYLIVDYDAEGLKARAWGTAALLVGAGLFVVALALAAGWALLGRLVLRPVATLTAASRRLADGDLTARAPAAASGDEIAELGGAFNHMAARLADTVDDLRERDHFLQGVMDAIPDGVRVIAEDFSVVAANREFLRQSGLDFETALSQPCYASTHGRAEPCVPTLVVCPLVALEGGADAVKCMHHHVRRGMEGEFAAEVVAAALTIETRDGPRRFIVEAIRDLSQSLQVSQEQRLAEIGQLATGVAHEIHNPLASIQFGLSALATSVASQPNAAESLNYVKLVAAEIERCIDITGRLMRLSQTPGEAGTLLDLGAVARDVVSLLAYEAMTRQISLVVRGFDKASVIANEGEIGMVLLNLVQNAFHATPPLGVIAIEGTLDSAGDVVIEVTDTGSGIAPDDLKRIFQPFWSRRADQTAGSGLGLPISRAMVEKWGGRISVRSRVGFGTAFTIVFPHAERMIDAA